MSAYIHNHCLDKPENPNKNHNASSNLDNRKSLEKELCSQVSNVVSSFFSKLDPKPSH